MLAEPGTVTTNPVPTSKTLATCGRIVHVYIGGSIEPRPAIVLSATNLAEVEENKIRCNVELDSDVDSNQEHRTQASRTWLCNLYDPLTQEQRDYLACRIDVWAEWMPFQKGQAGKVDELTPRVEELERMLGSQPSPSEAWTRLRAVEDVLLKYLKASGANKLAAELGGGQ